MMITRKEIEAYKDNNILQEIMPSLLKTVEHAGTYALYLKQNQQYKIPLCSEDNKSCAVPNVQLPADVMIENFIFNHLTLLTKDIPIISEERMHNCKQIPDIKDKTFLCVDPLDGSYCFAHNDQPFSIQLALIVKEEPVLGISHYPKDNITYFGHYGMHSKIKENGNICDLPYYNRHYEKLDHLKAYISNASADREYIKKYLQHLGINHSEIVKGCPNLCHVIDGQCDVFPIFHPNYEWDTAAYDAILRYTNDANTPCLFNLNGTPVKYGKDGSELFKNQHVIATPNASVQKKIIQYAHMDIHRNGGNDI